MFFCRKLYLYAPYQQIQKWILEKLKKCNISREQFVWKTYFLFKPMHSVELNKRSTLQSPIVNGLCKNVVSFLFLQLSWTSCEPATLRSGYRLCSGVDSCTIMSPIYIYIYIHIYLYITIITPALLTHQQLGRSAASQLGKQELPSKGVWVFFYRMLVYTLVAPGLSSSCMLLFITFSHIWPPKCDTL